MATPAHNGVALGIQEGRQFAVDNENFTRGFDPDRFFQYLEKLQPWRSQCLFVAIPDVVGDAALTIEMFHKWADHQGFQGWPLAFVAQDRLKVDVEEQHLYVGSDLDITDYCRDTPYMQDPEYYDLRDEWRQYVEIYEFDWLFIGGTTEWKMSSEADDCIRQVKKLGTPVHVGRVNSLKRMRHFKLMEVDSVDGTFPIYEPDTARARLSKGLAQPALFSVL